MRKRSRWSVAGIVCSLLVACRTGNGAQEGTGSTGSGPDGAWAGGGWVDGGPGGPGTDAGGAGAPWDGGRGGTASDAGGGGRDASDQPDGSGAVTGMCGDGVVPGCTAAGANDFNCQLRHDGVNRSYRLHVPPGYAQRPAAGAPLVFNFHGLNTNASMQEYFSEMNAAADARGYVVITPQGVGNSWNAGRCCGTAVSSQADDVGFTDAILERVRGTVCVDSRRVFAAGLSNGGHMAYRLACERADVFASVASVAGVVALGTCSPGRPVGVLHVHGNSDTVVSYTYGIDGFNGAQRVVDAWRERNGCGGSSSVSYQEGDVTCRAYNGCNGGSAAELCTVEDGGHQWPGGNAIPLLGHKSDDLDASAYILDFFSLHPRP